MRSGNNKLELWAGVECTVNRVRNEYIEQLDRSGHTKRISDLDRFAELGIRALRQPVLWERVAPEGLPSADWCWTDEWLSRLRDLGIRPIAGLVHHGSGPRDTSLLDECFPEKLADYARAVAERYPWVAAYTPVNEPLTTARFSGLYGHWYPHGRDDWHFVAALLNECRAVILAMRAVRQVNPHAQLVQTDDLGKIYSTPTLRYQAEFENERRWLTWDLLCGRVDRAHPMWGYLLRQGASPALLEWFVDNACPPDVIGINHYLSSDRYLDEHLERYPTDAHGGNGWHKYADVLAARVRAEGAAGPATLLRETWERYHIPLAVTEAHNGSTREEQLRWFLEVWNAAQQLRGEGADIRAVTAWSLLGAFDWNSLVTRNEGNYEPGVFDIRASQPRATAIADLVSKLACGEQPHHPLLEVPGWWKRPQRLSYRVALTDRGKVLRAEGPQSLVTKSQTEVRPVLITGGRGTLGRAIARACVIRGIPHRLLLRSEMDIADRDSVQDVFSALKPWAIINAAGYVRVDEAETDWARCYRENADGPAVLAGEAKRAGAQLVTFSSDLVFDGSKSAAYVEGDRVNPLNRYGHSKVLAEKRVLDILPSALVVRTSAFFSPWDEYNFVTIALRTMAGGQMFRAATDATVSPTYVPDLVNATLDTMIDGEHGIWHFANAGEITWAELAVAAAEEAGVSRGMVEPVLTRDLNLPAPRPLYSALRSARSWHMPFLSDALRRFVSDCVVPWRNEALEAA